LIVFVVPEAGIEPTPLARPGILADGQYELTAHISVALAHPCLDFTDVRRH